MRKGTYLFFIVVLVFTNKNLFSYGFDNTLTPHFVGTTTSTSVTDYLNINRANLIVTNAFESGATQDEQDYGNYHCSILKLGEELGKFGANVAPYNTANGGVYNLNYSNNYFRKI
ncbi:MAG: hypothetical protein IPF58_01360 [Saprospirales bacterium]|nr:hypothetical protein [Saprospirales bacterium]